MSTGTSIYVFLPERGGQQSASQQAEKRCLSDACALPQDALVPHCCCIYGGTPQRQLSLWILFPRAHTPSHSQPTPTGQSHPFPDSRMLYIRVYTSIHPWYNMYQVKTWLEINNESNKKLTFRGRPFPTFCFLEKTRERGNKQMLYRFALSNGWTLGQVHAPHNNAYTFVPRATKRSIFLLHFCRLCLQYSTAEYILF